MAPPHAREPESRRKQCQNPNPGPATRGRRRDPRRHGYGNSLRPPRMWEPFRQTDEDFHGSVWLASSLRRAWPRHGRSRARLAHDQGSIRIHRTGPSAVRCSRGAIVRDGRELRACAAAGLLSFPAVTDTVADPSAGHPPRWPLSEAARWFGGG